MPETILLVAEIAAAAATATETGIGIYDKLNAPDPNKIAAEQTNKLQQAQLASNDAQKAERDKAIKAAIARALPGLQSDTSGATSPEYNASIAGIESGTGNPNLLLSALNSLFGKEGGEGGGGGGGGLLDTSGAGSKETMFPSAAVPSFTSFMPNQGGDQNQPQGLSGGST